MTALFGKLENMLHNSLYVNFLLTGLVAQLACYPQPLLRSFLLNTNMVFQPSVKSLLQVPGVVVLGAGQASRDGRWGCGWVFKRVGSRSVEVPTGQLSKECLSEW